MEMNIETEPSPEQYKNIDHYFNIRERDKHRAAQSLFVVYSLLNRLDKAQQDKTIPTLLQEDQRLDVQLSSEDGQTLQMHRSGFTFDLGINPAAKANELAFIENTLVVKEVLKMLEHWINNLGRTLDSFESNSE